MADNTVLEGDAAELSFLHQVDATALSCALSNLEILFGPVSAERSSSTTTTAEQNAARIPGSLVITTSAILFWNVSNIQKDLLIPGELIDLHAILADDEDLPMALYLQISNDDDTLMEVTIYVDSNCEEIFRAVTKLIELHPQALSEHDDDDDNHMIMASDQNLDNEATFQEREEMLERLDQLLVVPPEYEVSENDEGQFDDANEEHDLL